MKKIIFVDADQVGANTTTFLNTLDDGGHGDDSDDDDGDGEDDDNLFKICSVLIIHVIHVAKPCSGNSLLEETQQVAY